MTSALVGSAKITIEGDLSAFATSAESQIRTALDSVGASIDNDTESVAQKFGQMGASGGAAFAESVNSAVGEASASLADSAAAGGSAAVDSYGTVGTEAGAAFTSGTTDSLDAGSSEIATSAGTAGGTAGEAIGAAYADAATSTLAAASDSIQDALVQPADSADVEGVFGEAGQDAGGAFSDGVSDGAEPAAGAMPDAINQGKPLVVAAAQDAALEAGSKGGQKFGEAFKSSSSAIMTTIFAGGGLFGAAELLKGSIEAAGAAQAAGIKTENVFGEAGGGVEKFADDSVKSLRETSDEIQAQVSAFGQYFKSLGVNQATAAQMGETLTTVTDNVAAFNGVSQGTVQSAFDAAIKGRATSLRQYGINIDATTLAHEALTRGIVGTNDKLVNGLPVLTAQQKGLATYYAILDQTKTQQDGLAASSHTGAAVQAEFRAEMTEFETKVGTGLLPILSATTSFLTNNLFPALYALAGFWQSNEAWLKPLLETLGGALVVYKGLELAQDGVRKAQEAVVAVQGTYNGLLAMFGSESAAATIGQDAYTAAMAEGSTAAEAAAAAETEVDAAMDANPIGLVVIAIAALAAGLYYAYTHSAPFRTFIKGMGSDLKSVWTDVLQPVVNFFERNWKSALTIAFDVFLPFVALPLMIYNNWGAITGFFSSLWGDVTGFFKTAIHDVVGFIEEWYPEILGILSGGILLVPALIFKYWDQITSFVSTAWDHAISFLEGIGGKVIGIFAQSGTWLLDIGMNIIGGLGDGFEAGWAGVKYVFQDVVNDGIDAINEAIGLINDVINGISSAYDWTGLPSIPDIPKVPSVSFAAGGMVNGKTFAMLGDNPSGKEVAIPLDSPRTVTALAGAMGQALQSLNHGMPLGDNTSRPKDTTGSDSAMLNQLNTLTAAVMKLANRPIVLKTDNRTIAKSANTGNTVLARVA